MTTETTLPTDAEIGHAMLDTSRFGLLRNVDAKPFLVTQTLADFEASLRSDPAYPRSRVRSFLSRHGLRGKVLKSELDRITDGHYKWLRQDPDNRMLSVGVDRVRYPYGWPKSAMTPLMKRMFHNHDKPVFNVILDEFHFNFPANPPHAGETA